jgi:hypothetical protein
VRELPVADDRAQVLVVRPDLGLSVGMDGRYAMEKNPALHLCFEEVGDR